MQNLIPPEIRPVIKHAAYLSRRECSDGSETFTDFAYTALRNAAVVPDNVTKEVFSPCDYLPHLQQVLFSTDELDTSVTYETLVVVPEHLNNSLYELFGDEMEFNGPFVSYDVSFKLFTCSITISQSLSLCNLAKLLDNFGHMSLRRFINFFSDLFSVTASGRRLEETQQKSPAMMKGALMRATRQQDLQSHVRVLEASEEPLIVLELNQYISVTFDFNFGDGQKTLLLGVLFHYDGGDTITNS